MGVAGDQVADAGYSVKIGQSCLKFLGAVLPESFVLLPVLVAEPGQFLVREGNFHKAL